jgi:hypothetical protein
MYPLAATGYALTTADQTPTAPAYGLAAPAYVTGAAGDALNAPAVVSARRLK